MIIPGTDSKHILVEINVMGVVLVGNRSHLEEPQHPTHAQPLTPGDPACSVACCWCSCRCCSLGDLLTHLLEVKCLVDHRSSCRVSPPGNVDVLMAGLDYLRNPLFSAIQIFHSRSGSCLGAWCLHPELHLLNSWLSCLQSVKQWVVGSL